MAATLRLVYLLLGAMFIAPVAHSSYDKPDTGKDGYGIRTVVLDAGHGGKDAGCVGSSSYEKEIALGVTLKVGKYIEENIPDVKVIYTRTTDVFVPLDERAEIANKNNADIFVSIHCNAANSKAAYGTETWVMGMHKSEENLKVAKRENKVIMMEDNYEEKYEYDPTSPVSHIVFSIRQYAHQEQSIKLAKVIQDEFRERAQRKDRGVKQAGLVVLFKTTMPSVLVESGFLTNNNEEEFLRSTYGQEIIASAIYRGFKNYKYEVESEYLALNPLINPIDLPDKDKKIHLEEKEAKLSNEPPPKKDQIDTAEKEPSEGITQLEKDNVELRVQIFASGSLTDVDSEPFRSLNGVYTDQTKGGIFRYFYGSYYDYEKAKKGLKEAQKAGFRDAFLAAYKNGKRIDMPETIAISE